MAEQMNAKELHEEFRSLKARLAELRGLQPIEARRAAVIDGVRSGASITEMAAEFCMSYSWAAQIVWEHESATGERLPRSKRGPEGGSRPGTAERHAEITLAYKEAGNLQVVAERYGITQERVRQIICKHEQRTGEKIGRARKRRADLVRVEWVCPSCGERRTLAPSVARRSERCRSCASLHQWGNGRSSAANLENAIRQKIAGASWHALAIPLGYASNTAHLLTGAVYRYLLRQRRASDILALWPAGVPHWLRSRFGELGGSADREAA